jgi:hypothetical protein
MDDGIGGDLQKLTPDELNTIETERVVENLVQGRLYTFTYRLKNANGWSPFADTIQIRAAIVPIKPAAPTLI